MTEEEEWVKTAMSDDSIVVEMLLRLHQAEPRPAPRLAPRKKGAAPVLQLEWSVRQRRSRQKVRRKKGDATRASPTTPLSWSGATSVSGGAADGGFEESSKPSKPIDNARSKVCFCVFLCVSHFESPAVLSIIFDSVARFQLVSVLVDFVGTKMTL